MATKVRGGKASVAWSLLEDLFCGFPNRLTIKKHIHKQKNEQTGKKPWMERYEEKSKTVAVFFYFIFYCINFLKI